MTETQNVSIEEVRALVVERQRYDDWLTALDARRDETPVRVFERVQGDYIARRRDVMHRLREHVGGLTSMRSDLDERLASLESRLGTLEDERAEAMLRTAVGEFDADRWEQVRQDVEAQIAELGDQRTVLQAEGDEVRALLASAQSEPGVGDGGTVRAEEPSEAQSPVAEVASSDSVSGTLDELLDAPLAESPVPHAAPLIDGLVDGLVVDDTLTATDATAAAELAELDNALALFSNSPPTVPNTQAIAPTVSTPLMDGLDVFDDAELGDLRMAPPTRATATATPPAANHGVGTNTNGVAMSEGFDDLAFLRSVVEPSAQGGQVRANASGDQQKTLRCTECSTMNLPTEWYCERCGGELAAF